MSLTKFYLKNKKRERSEKSKAPGEATNRRMVTGENMIKTMHRNIGSKHMDRSSFRVINHFKAEYISVKHYY